jgi:CDP-glycerol glycerophosphotransferase
VRRFTFARGNAQKVLALPLYALGALASTLVRRKPNLWVFGSGSGVGEGALALLIFARAADPSIRVVWLARNPRDVDDARALGIPAVLKSSWRGFRMTLRARVVVVTHGFGDVNRFGTRGSFVVQLWHGIPFKHINLDSQATLRVPLLSGFGFARSIARRVYARSGRGIGMFATASPTSADRIRTAFALPADRVVVTGDPRDDVLATSSPHEARQRLAALLGAPEATSARVLLYAPTWRDGQRDPAVPDAADWAKIGDYLAATDSLLVVRPHPLGVGDYSPGAVASDRVRMLGADLVGDVTPLLPAVDVLITDYSSIAFDYSLTGGQIVFLAPDFAEYSSSRGVYESFRDFSGGSEVASWPALLGLLERLDSDPAVASQLRAHVDRLGRRMHAFRDGRNTERVYHEIIARLGGSAQ